MTNERQFEELQSFVLDNLKFHVPYLTYEWDVIKNFLASKQSAMQLTVKINGVEISQEQEWIDDSDIFSIRSKVIKRFVGNCLMRGVIALEIDKVRSDTSHISKKPMTGKVLILQDKEAETESGLFIPTEAQIKPFSGIVASVGNNVDLQPNTRVYFAKSSGLRVEVDGVEYLILRQEEILLIEENNNE